MPRRKVACQSPVESTEKKEESFSYEDHDDYTNGTAVRKRWENVGQAYEQWLVQLEGHVRIKLNEGGQIM